MANRKRKPQTKTARLKATRSKRAANTTPVSSKDRTFPRNTVCLSSYRQTRTLLADVAVGDVINCTAPLASDHSAEIMLFTGVQIVRDDSRNINNE